jgi:hypothetical protein
MEKTPLQNVIDKLEKVRKESNLSPNEKSIMFMVISKLWDELNDERVVLTKIFDSGKNNEVISGDMWIEKTFIDYQKTL